MLPPDFRGQCCFSARLHAPTLKLWRKRLKLQRHADARGEPSQRLGQSSTSADGRARAQDVQVCENTFITPFRNNLPMGMSVLSISTNSLVKDFILLMETINDRCVRTNNFPGNMASTELMDCLVMMTPCRVCTLM